MRCRYCAEPARWWRRCCSDCDALRELFRTHRGADPATLMDSFILSGVARGKIEKFLDADPDGTGTVRDHIAADMANQLLEALGQRGRQTARDVKRIRERGAWIGMDRRPPE